ncbi:putative CASP8-associated protein 2-like isoform X1 [Sesbania bispinosa]|nr:putative CASP8-associated protein 2-like isoform X1 [Sesbania bispinosa]
MEGFVVAAKRLRGEDSFVEATHIGWKNAIVEQSRWGERDCREVIKEHERRITLSCSGDIDKDKCWVGGKVRKKEQNPNVEGK